jgi:hypothetical protein
MNTTITNAHHNLLVNNLCASGNIPALTLLENIPTTYLSNRAAPQNLIVQDMSAKHNILSYDHSLSNAPNVVDAQSFVNIDNQRFVSYDVTYDNAVRNWNGSLQVQCDKTQIINDVVQSHQAQNYQYNIELTLSLNNLIYITPTAQPNNEIHFKLSDLISDILPKIKIPVSYHQNGTADIICVLLDDNIQNKQQLLAQSFPMIFDNINDTYHEMVIAGDANIVWDACRDAV